MNPLHPASITMHAVAFDGIHRAYKPGEDVLHGVSFAIMRGQVVGLLGRNGAGKTTLLRIALGLIAPHQGSVRVLGLDPRHDPVEVKRRVGYVSEDQILQPFLRIAEVCAFHRFFYPTWDEEEARRLRRQFALDPAARIGDLSKGQARQVALMCAVAHRPELLVLDEPAGGLDPIVRREFLETAIRLLNEAGATILFSSHYMADVERLAERVVILHEGRVLIDEPLDELREKHALVLVPGTGDAAAARVATLSGCLALHRRGDALRAVFALPPERARRSVAEELGVSAVQARSVELEEMFVELLGGQP